MKKNRHHREPASSDSERSFDSLSTYSSRSSNTLDCKPGLAWLLNRQLLGQHAGELLLDLHQFNKKESDSSTYTMPGIIVKDTEVRLQHHVFISQQIQGLSLHLFVQKTSTSFKEMN